MMMITIEVCTVVKLLNLHIHQENNIILLCEALVSRYETEK